jgi:hypothetical protein
MAVLSLEEAMKQAAADQFWAIRGKAIQAYASLEQAMAQLFSLVSGTDGATANIIFFRINSADSRNKITKKLFQNKFGTRYNLFRNSLFKQIGPIDRERNEVVHWNVVNFVDADPDGNTRSTLALLPPANWVLDHGAPKKTTEDLIAFSRKCDFYSLLLRCLFAIEGNTGLPEYLSERWAVMFEGPIVYPPPPGHVLFNAEPDHHPGSVSIDVDWDGPATQSSQ